MQHRPLHEVHVADGDGGKVDGVERGGQRVHVGRHSVRPEVADRPEMKVDRFFEDSSSKAAENLNSPSIEIQQGI